eukprot:219280_1
MAHQFSPYDLDDISNQPRCNTSLCLDCAVLQLEVIDAAQICTLTVRTHGNQKNASRILFNHLIQLWETIDGIWEMLKQVHKELKSKKILSETFTHWVPHFLYQNDILHPTITDGKEYSYKQIRRYIRLPFEKVREFWELDNDKGLILPCDQMIGPFISNNRQLFRAGELYKLMKREQQRWNDQISVLNNCRAMRHLIYFYSDMWPFQMITFNKYDRKIWFDANPSEGARRDDLEIRG